MNCLKTVCLCACLLVLFVLFALPRPASAQTWSLPTVTYSGAYTDPDIYCATSGTGSAFYNDLTSDGYEIKVITDVDTVQVTFVDHFGAQISQTQYSLGGNGTYPDNVTTYSDGNYLYTEDVPWSGHAYAVPPSSYANWGAWISSIKPSNAQNWKLDFHVTITLTIQDVTHSTFGSGEQVGWWTYAVFSF